MPELRTAQDFREAPTRTIAAAGAQFAYREPGPRAGVQLVLLTHPGANLDNRGPHIVDGLAQDRRVITVDYRGAGNSTGTVRNSMEAMAADMVTATGPVLTVHGDSGRMVPPQNATAPARHLPTATVTVFPNSGQGPPSRTTARSWTRPGTSRAVDAAPHHHPSHATRRNAP
jgi:pimeloyl-ACP methyl ester carboxylesterase